MAAFTPHRHHIGDIAPKTNASSDQTKSMMVSKKRLNVLKGTEEVFICVFLLRGLNLALI